MKQTITNTKQEGPKPLRTLRNIPIGRFFYATAINNIKFRDNALLMITHVQSVPTLGPGKIYVTVFANEHDINAQNGAIAFDFEAIVTGYREVLSVHIATTTKE